MVHLLSHIIIKRIWEIACSSKTAIICCNRKAYYLEVSAIGNVDKWFDKVEQSITFYDFAKVRRYCIAFMVLLSIAMVIALFFIIRDVVIFIKRDTKRKSKVIWIYKRAHNLYKYIKANIIPISYHTITFWHLCNSILYHSSMLANCCISWLQVAIWIRV